MEPTTFAPSVLMPDGTTVYPTKELWVRAFALAGCPWALKIEEEWRQEAEKLPQRRSIILS